MPTTPPPRSLTGVPVVAGVRYARVIRPGAAVEPDLGAGQVAVGQRAAQQQLFEAAVAAVAARLRDRAARSSGAAAEVLAATAALAQDRAWLSAAGTRIAEGVPAPRAVHEAVAQFAGLFTEMGGLMAERAIDLLDIRDRVVAELRGLPEPGVPTPDSPSILCARELAPADAAGLDPDLVVGVATTLGGPTGHTAIIARQLGITCVVAVGGLDDVEAGTPVLIDGTRGTVVIAPDPAAAVAEVRRAATVTAATAARVGPGATADGHRVELLVNVQDGAAARSAARTPAEGVGLFRTELCFLNRETEPTVDEQARVYREVLAAFGGRKVIIRTLDAGSDKPLKFAGRRDEANPALGVRGIRIAVADPGLLDRQLAAIAAAARATATAPWVMAPMIATPAEARDFAERARGHGLEPGVMIEVPGAALSADRMLEHVDFLSVGTNDLAQYTMAADRMSADLAALTDPWQPAVLTLVAATAAAGARAGKPVGVCGEAAADPLLACVFAGMGIGSLSSAVAAVRAVGARLSSVSLARCREAAAAVLETAGPAEARAVASAILAE